MVKNTDFPRPYDIARFLFDTVRHALSVEAVTYSLGIEGSPRAQSERPHDLAGINSKLCYQVMSGLSLAYKEPGYSHPLIDVAKKLHREQWHHRVLNGSYEDSSTDDQAISAVDVILAMRENRPYNGGSFTFEQIALRTGELVHGDIIRDLLSRVQGCYGPIEVAVGKLTSLADVPKVSLPGEIVIDVVSRLDVTLAYLENTSYPGIRDIRFNPSHSR